MICNTCGAQLADNAKFCTSCGTPVKVKEPAEKAAPVTPPPAAPVPPRPAAAPVPPRPIIAAPVLPPENRPLGAWAYFGLQLLFAIPLVGFICLIVFSLDNSNINRRNFARSYWCGLVIGLVVSVLIIILLTATGVAAGVFSEISQIF